jgi:hypothetical protein
MEIADTLDFLLGTWQLTRLIEDHRSGVPGSFDGRATLAEPRAEGNGAPLALAAYDEQGELCVGTRRAPATRRLAYARLANGTAMVYFFDGRPFVDLDLRSGEWWSVHPCHEDRYETTTVVRSADVVEERWRVRGPAKDYDAVTTFVRLTPGTGPLVAAEHRPSLGSQLPSDPSRVESDRLVSGPSSARPMVPLHAPTGTAQARSE